MAFRFFLVTQTSYDGDFVIDTPFSTQHKILESLTDDDAKQIGLRLGVFSDPEEEMPLEVFRPLSTSHSSTVLSYPPEAMVRQRSIVDTPPSSRYRGPRPGTVARQPLSASGTTRVLTHGKRGEVNGVVLSDGTVMRLPPPVVMQFYRILVTTKPVYWQPMAELSVASRAVSTPGSKYDCHGTNFPVALSTPNLPTY